jgi:hypothetical protein
MHNRGHAVDRDERSNTGALNVEKFHSASGNLGTRRELTIFPYHRCASTMREKGNLAPARRGLFLASRDAAKEAALDG